MPSSVPPRRFAPEPIETSTKSSKAARQQSPEKDEKPKPRRFAVEPIESSTKSSRGREAQHEETAKPRRFAPEPVETSVKSSKDKADGSEKPKPRRFAPQLESTSRASTRTTSEENAPHIRFSPQPLETIYRTNRKPRDDDDLEKKASRKFAPVLVDTARRSRRAGDSAPALAPHDKKESEHHLHARELRRHIRGDKSPAGEREDGSDIDVNGQNCRLSPQMLDLHPELRRQPCPVDGTPRPRPLSMTSVRSHSFRCPDLDTIESSESEPNSQASSLSSSPDQGSPITASDSSFHDMYKHATRRRESIDENFQHYLLQLEAKKAQQRLEEQALAAFPNSDFHEPVQHYAYDDNSDDMEIEDRPVTWAGFEDDLLLEMAARRGSTVKMSWEQMELQRHAERMEQERNAAKTTAKQHSQSPWWTPGDDVGLGQRDNELRSMQDRARPPMLGSDLVFPRCPSPEPARFDVTQGSTTLRNQMCYLTEHLEAESKRSDEEGGLWHAPEVQDEYVSAARGPAFTVKRSTSKGLWGGYCVDDGEHDTPGTLQPPTGPTGLMTPYPDTSGNPFEQSFAAPGAAVPVGVGMKTPPTPPRSLQSADLGRIDGVLNTEQELDDLMKQQYDDSFITQVYNYLSLGYPSLARPFDEELSKISRISMADLRQDDKTAKALPRGYIRLGPDFEGGGGEGVTEDSCMRWQALKLYVREWARQEKDMVRVENPGGNWGTGARRGSWAW